MYEEAAELVQQDRPGVFNDTLRQVFDHRKLPRPLGKGTVRHLPHLAKGPVLTTNLDRVIEAAFEDVGRRFEDVFPGSRIREATRVINLHQPCLLKLRGDYFDDSSRVLTLSEYRREYGATVPAEVRWDLPLPRVLSLAVGSNPLLFLGCSLGLETDRATLIVAQIAQEWAGIGHFALLSDAANVPERLRQFDKWHIRPIFFPVGCFEKIEQSLDCLGNAITSRERDKSPESIKGRSAESDAIERRCLTRIVGRDAEAAALRQVLLSNSRSAAEQRLAEDTTEKAIFVSYAWGGESDNIADQIDQAFSEKGVTIIRDKREMAFKGSVRDFMERIGRGKCVIIIISEKYLKSHNCMFELLVIAKHHSFVDRIFPIVLDDARIHKPIDRIRYVQYWEEEIKKLDRKLKSVSAANLQGFREDIDLYTKIRESVSNLTNILNDMNTLTVQIHKESGFGTLFNAIEAKLSG